MSTGVMTRDTRVPRGTRPPMDPRLQARRVEVARDQGRRRLRRLVTGLVVVLVLVGLGAMTRSPLLDVDHIEVAGARHLDADDVRRAAGIETGRAMVSVDAPAAEARLAALPWIASATVTRTWPGTVAITVTERRPVAVVGTGASARLVDGDGRVLGPVGSIDGLPLIAAAAPGSTAAQLPAHRRSLAATMAKLSPELAGQVARAFTGPQGVTLELDDGIRVLFGDATRVTAKDQNLRAVLEQADRSTIERIDITVPSAPALTPRRQEGA